MSAIAHHISFTSTLLALVANGCYGYGLGAPGSACGHVFPAGHGANASTDTPPFEIVLSKTSYNPGDTIEVQLSTTTSSGQLRYTGVLVQVRSWNCTDTAPLGQFSVQANEGFLQPIPCFGLEKSALRHYTIGSFSTKTFYWTAPSTSSGHVFVRATVVVSRMLFWSNVFSPIITDNNDQTNTTSFGYCPVRMLYEPRACTNSNGNEDSGSASCTACIPSLIVVTAMLLFLQ